MTQTEDLMTVAVQVAHDIRSPLAALAVIEQDLSALPDETRALLKAAISRIKEIATDLLDRTRGSQVARGAWSARGGAPSATRTRTPIAPLITSLLSEKRAQYREATGLELRAELPASELSALIWPVEFRRAVSNLVDNAIEACEGVGRMTVSISGSQGKIWIAICDDGKGMSAEVLRNAGRKGYTSGKNGGSGLGLAHAKSTVEACGGALWIESVLGQGTTVILQLSEALVGANS